MCYNGTYRPVCGVGWDDADAAVICSMIGKSGTLYGMYKLNSNSTILAIVGPYSP